MEEYHAAMTKLAIDVLRMIASTLDLDQSYFDDFCEKPVATLRLLHYPPQDPATLETERGKGSQDLIYTGPINDLLCHRNWCTYRLWCHHYASSG